MHEEITNRDLELVRSGQFPARVQHPTVFINAKSFACFDAVENFPILTLTKVISCDPVQRRVMVKVRDRWDPHSK